MASQDSSTSAPPRPDVFYRLRSSEKLLDYKELEHFQIYLASPDALNDPMEGYKEVSLRGDEVLWENLFRHYVLALTWTFAGFLFDDRPFEEPRIPAALTADDLPTDAFRELYSAACDAFMQHPASSAALRHLQQAGEPVSRNTTKFVLSMLSGPALSAVVRTLHQSGLFPGSPDELLGSTEALEPTLAEIIGRWSSISADEMDGVAFATNVVNDQQRMRHLFHLDGTPDNAFARRIHYLLSSFADRYFDGVIDQLVHPPWRTACFTATCTNASNWAAYGENHRGVALMYRPLYEEQQPYLPLVTVTGYAGGADGTIRWDKGTVKAKLEPVDYTNRLPSIEFFASLGNLARGKLDRAWATGRDGKRSALMEAMFSERAAWRNAYWSTYRKVMTTKLEDWRHEQEYRIVLPDTLGLGDEHRLAEYDPSTLSGIVFGMKTPERHKLEIMRQVARYCERVGRKDFDFFQIAYNTRTGCLVRV